MSNKNKQIRPSFTLEFKQSAAKLVNEKGYSQRQAADSLGVSLSALSRWVRAEQGSSNSAPTQKKVFNLLEQDELTRLRKEVAQLRMEREILKNSPLGTRFPMQRNSLLLHSDCVQTLAVCFLEVKSPSKNLADGKLRTQLWRHFM